MIGGIDNQSIIEADDDSLASTPRRPTIYVPDYKPVETFEDGEDGIDHKEVNVSVLDEPIQETE
jgi:hypothetical protein